MNSSTRISPTVAGLRLVISMACLIGCSPDRATLEDTYVCPVGKRLTYCMATEEARKVLRRHLRNVPANNARVAHCENEAVLDRV